MPLAYDNSVGNSEATLTLSDTLNWTVKGVMELSLWFRGEPNNAAEPMYVALNGNAVVYHENPDAALITEWTEWNINLQAFADQGVNLTNMSIRLLLVLVTGATLRLAAQGSSTSTTSDCSLKRRRPQKYG
jgi:hypothetical protein